MTVRETKKLNEDMLFETLSRTFCNTMAVSVKSDLYDASGISIGFLREMEFLFGGSVDVPQVVRKSLNGYRTHDHDYCRKIYKETFGDVDKLFGNDLKENVIKAISFGIKLNRPSTTYSEIVKCANNQFGNWRISDYDSGYFSQSDRSTALVDLIGRDAYNAFDFLVSAVQRVYDLANAYPDEYSEAVDDIYYNKGQFIREMLDCDPEVFVYTHIFEHPLYGWLRSNILRIDMSDREAIDFVSDLLKDIRKYKDLRILNTI